MFETNFNFVASKTPAISGAMRKLLVSIARAINENK